MRSGVDSIRHTGAGLSGEAFPAYDGDEPYVFVCYAHEDEALVYPEVARLNDAGFRIWYDEGISLGSEWSTSLAEHIERCAVFLYFVTPRSDESEWLTLGIPRELTAMLSSVLTLAEPYNPLHWDWLADLLASKETMQGRSKRGRTR